MLFYLEWVENVLHDTEAVEAGLLAPHVLHEQVAAARFEDPGNLRHHLGRVTDTTCRRKKKEKKSEEELFD